MIRIFKALGACVFALSLLPASLSAATLTLTSFGGPIPVQVDLAQMVDDVLVTFSQPSATVKGDFRAVYFSFDAGFNFAGFDATRIMTDIANTSLISVGCAPIVNPGAVSQTCDSDTNMNGSTTPDTFDVGIQLGAAGNDNIETFAFKVTGVFVSDFAAFGARVKSITGNNGSSSDKLAGTCTTCDSDLPGVPEPSAYLLLGAGLAAISLLKRRKPVMRS